MKVGGITTLRGGTHFRLDGVSESRRDRRVDAHPNPQRWWNYRVQALPAAQRRNQILRSASSSLPAHGRNSLLRCVERGPISAPGQTTSPESTEWMSMITYMMSGALHAQVHLGWTLVGQLPSPYDSALVRNSWGKASYPKACWSQYQRPRCKGGCGEFSWMEWRRHVHEVSGAKSVVEQ